MDKLNKKILIISIIVITVLAIIILITKRNKNLEIEIIDSYGEEITDLEQNTMPFTIIKKDENQKIMINGEEYEDGKRIYNIGEYNIEISNDNKKNLKTININEIVKEENSEYNIYISTETLNTLFHNLKICDNINQKGFVWTARTSTVNIDNIKENFKNLKISDYLGEMSKDDFIKQVIPELQQYIKQVLQEDSNAYFHLYTEEDNFYLELELFGKIGLNDNRYDFTMYSNGTLSYVRQYEITETDKYNRFLEERDNYFEIVDKIKNNTLVYNEYPGSYLVDKNSPVFNIDYNMDYMLISTLKDNVRYLLQYPEFLEFEDDNIKKEMENANIEKIVAQDEFNKLDDIEKEIFFKNISLDKEELDKNYFNENREYLIITGTYPFYGEYTEEEFKTMIKKVCDLYQENYIILYKPHPNELPTEEQEAFLQEQNIKVLPGKIPMEAILFIYPNIKVGGFSSSLYMSVDEGKIEFFFARDEQDLVEPLNNLYNTLFYNAKFIQP